MKLKTQNIPVTGDDVIWFDESGEKLRVRRDGHFIVPDGDQGRRIVALKDRPLADRVIAIFKKAMNGKKELDLPPIATVLSLEEWCNRYESHP